MKTVLLLEDDEVSLALYQRVLGREFRVRVATTPEEAVEICRAESVDLFVADNLLSIPVTGLETFTRAHEIRNNMCLLLVSGTPPEGFTDSDFARFDRLVRDGVCEFLQKPFRTDALMACATGMLEGKLSSSDTRSALERAIAYRQSTAGE